MHELIGSDFVGTLQVFSDFIPASELPELWRDLL